MTTTDVLKQCTIEGNVVKLPAITLERKLYMDVAKQLDLIGGKWKGGKTMGFVFEHDPAELLHHIQGGGDSPKKPNLKKEFQFFGTPADLADDLVDLAKIRDNHTVLEPSAGQGAIVKAILKRHPNQQVYYYELMPTNRIFMQKIKNTNYLGEDFLQSDMNEFDRIVANPPFA